MDAEETRLKRIWELRTELNFAVYVNYGHQLLAVGRGVIPDTSMVTDRRSGREF